jgi:MYXO-CTERM domain-containing protein
MAEWASFPGLLWDRIVAAWQVGTPQAPPWMWALVGVAAIAALRNRWVWRRVNHWVTLLHEAGHAVVALATGRRLHGLHVHGDGGGLTSTSGGGRLSRVAVSAAGYPAPAWLGAGLLAALVAGRFGAAAVVAGVVALVLLPWARSWRAVFGLMAVCAAAASYVWWAPAGRVTTAAALAMGALAAVAVLGAWRDLWQERRARSSGARTDVVNLAAVTALPAPLWWGVLGLLTLAAAFPVAWAAGAIPAAVT